MFFTSTPLVAEQALQYGFLNAVVPSSDLTRCAEDLARTIASRAPLVINVLKRQLKHLSNPPAISVQAFEELHEMRKQAWSSNDMEEGVVISELASTLPHPTISRILAAHVHQELEPLPD